MRRDDFGLRISDCGLHVAAALLLAMQVFAEELTLPDQRIYVGEPFVGSVLLENEQGAIAFDAISTPELSIKLVDASKVASNTVVRLSAIALRTGELTLPALSLRGTTHIYSVPERKITVAQPQASELVKISTAWSASQCYVGQPFTLDFTWNLNAPTEQFAGVDIRIPILEHPDFKVHDAAESPLPGSPKSIGLPVSGTRVIAATNGNVIRFKKVIVPKKAGTFALSPAHIVCSIRNEEKANRSRGFQYPSYFDNQFFHQPDDGSFKRIYQQAAPFTIKVNEVPGANQPPGFNGIFGAFSLSVTATPTEIQVGDPITLSIETSGHPYLETIELPPLGELTGFNGLFDVPRARAPGLIKNGTRTFRQTVRPMREGIKAIPAIQFITFDTEQKTYGTISSEPIPITVKPGSMAGAGDAILSDGTRLRSTVKPLAEGLVQNYSAEQLRRRSQLFDRPFTAWLLALGVPPLLFLAFNYGTRIQQVQLHQPEKARQLLAYKNYTQAEGKSARRRLQQYLSDKFILRKRFPVYQDVAEALNDLNLPADTHQQLQEFFDQSSRALFSREHKKDEASLDQAAHRMVEQLEERSKA